MRRQREFEQDAFIQEEPRQVPPSPLFDQEEPVFAAPAKIIRDKSYREIESFEGTQQDKVYKYIKENPNSSDAEIAEGTGIRTSSVNARRGVLVLKEYVAYSGDKIDPNTNKTVSTWEVTKKEYNSSK